jgi:hypothetical protein
MSFVPYPTTPDELITLLIADYPSKEKIIRSEVGWQHLNDRKVLADFFSQRMNDQARAEETINLGLNLKTEVQSVLGLRDYSDYLGPDGELPSIIMDFENGVYARKRGRVLRETHFLTEFPTGEILTGDDGIRRIRLDASEGDSPTLAIDNLELSAGTVVCYFQQENTVGNFERVWQLDDGTENNAIRLWLHSTEQYRLSVLSGGSAQTNLFGSTESIGPLMSRVACSWSEDAFRISMNGGSVTEGTGTVPPFDTFRLGHKVAGDKQPDGGIERLVIFEEQFSQEGQDTLCSLVRRFVDVSSGSDTGEALTEASPWQSPAYAAVNANPGDFTYLRAGTYTPFEIEASGKRDQYLSFIAYPGETVTIDGEGNPLSPGTGGSHLGGIRAIGRSFIRIAGIVIQNLTDIHTNGKRPNGIEILGSTTGFNQIGVQGIRIAKNQINNSRASAISCLGYLLSPNSQPPVVDSRIPIGLIRDLRVDSNTIGAHNLVDGVVEGISVGGGLKGFDISRNVMSASRQYGIDAKAGAEDGVISFNDISGQDAHGIYVDTGRWYCRRIYIFGNQIDSCGNNGIVLTREAGDVNPRHILEDIDIVGNLVRDCGERGVLIYPHVTDGDALDDGQGVFRRILVAHNTVVGHTSGAAEGIRIGPLGQLGTDITLANNICFGNTDNISIDDSMTDKVLLVSNVTADPSFTDAGGDDYTLQSGSIARNAADPRYTPDFDLLNNPRRDTTTPDAGAYEFIT